MTDIDLPSALRDQTQRFAALLPEADLAAPVPSCPDWDLRALTGHLGQAHRYAGVVLRQRVTSIEQRPGPTEAPVFDHGVGYRDWLVAGAEELIAAAAEVGGEGRVWNFATGSGSPAFWLRRMTHETAVHRYDAALAVGADYQLAAELASDALAEWLDILTSPGMAAYRPEMVAEPRGSGQTLQLQATDQPGGWLITRTPDGPRWEPGDTDTRATTTVRASALDLLLLTVGRLAPTDPRFEVGGDPTLLRDWCDHVTF